MPAVTYIVSAYDRPMHLRGCLASLQVQTDPDFEVIVADNGEMQAQHREVVREMRDRRMLHMNTAMHRTSAHWDCSESAEWVVAHEAKGDWFCMPSDDSYYMPVFQETCLRAAREHDWQLVFPEMLYDRRLNGSTYTRLNTRPSVCGIDKTGFLIHRSIWIGMPYKTVTADGEMIQEVIERGARWGKVEEILVIHN